MMGDIGKELKEDEGWILSRYIYTNMKVSKNKNKNKVWNCSKELKIVSEFENGIFLPGTNTENTYLRATDICTFSSQICMLDKRMIISQLTQLS